MSHCTIDSPKLAPIFLLLSLPELQALDIGHNIIDAVGGTTIATAMSRSKLTSLDLGSNRIGDKGRKAIKEA